MLTRNDPDKLHRRGLTERTSRGEQRVRLTAQCPAPLLDHSRQERRAVLESWQKTLQDRLANYRAELVPDSLSVLGQTVEVIVPLATLQSAEADIAGDEIRLEPVLPRQVTAGSRLPPFPAEAEAASPRGPLPTSRRRRVTASGPPAAASKAAPAAAASPARRHGPARSGAARSTAAR